MRAIQGPLSFKRASILEAIAVIAFAALISLFVHLAPYLAERLAG
jgi:hypothetical protein